jgi:hypothetical protein
MSRRFQFSLTWLVIATLVIGAFFGGVSVGRRCHELEHQRELADFQRQRDDWYRAMAQQRGNSNPYEW